MDTITSRRALLGGAGLAAVVAAMPVIAGTNPGTAVTLDPQWRAAVADFRTKHAAWTATLGIEDDQMSAFRRACASLGPEPKQPEDNLPADIRHMTIAQIKAAGDTAGNKAAWAAWQRDRDAWEEARKAMRERIVGPAKARHDAACNASSSAFVTLVDYPVCSLIDLGEKIEIVAADHSGGDVPIEYLESVLADVRRLAKQEG